MLAVTSPTGKLGSAVLNALLDNALIAPTELVVCTSTDPHSPQFTHLHAQSIPIRHADFDNPASLALAYTGCTSLFLVSTPRISMDYNSAPLWSGREAHHRAAIDAAISVGVQHIYYTSLAFANPSKASVMTAHIRTEAYLKEVQEQGRLAGFTILREGLYSESWALYFGYYFGMKEERRREVVVGGDGRVSWTSIADLGFVTAKILAGDTREWVGKTVYLSQRRTWSLGDVARIVSGVRGEEVRLKVGDRRQFEEFYVGVMGRERAGVEWWSSTYEALGEGECQIEDGTLEGILKDAGRAPKAFDETVREMLR